MILFKKAIRTMIHHKRAYISCMVLMALGVWTYTTMNTALNEIDSGKENYYEENNLADAFATVTQIPRSSLMKLEEIQGVDQVDGRIIQTLSVLLPDQEDEVIRLQVISTVMGENENRLNGYVQTGDDLQSEEDILVGYDFYNAAGFEPGDSIRLLVNRKLHDFNVAGYVYSPEYVYIVENEGELFSDTTKYNIAYMDENTLMDLYGQEGVYNDLSFRLEDGYEFIDVEDEIELALKDYGLIALYEKKDMFSYMMLEEEIKGGKSMSTTIPFAFVTMAAVVLYLMLKRVIEQDRTQIGILKAFGYSNRQVLLHYMSFGLITGTLGGILGLGMSYLSSGPYIQIYLDYYKIPITTQVTDFTYYIIGGLWSVGGGIIGAYFGARKLIHLKPADAMRPKAPPPVKKDIPWLVALMKPILTSRGYMTFRNILRNKIRSGFVVVSIVFSYSMMVMIGMMTGLIDNMFLNQFNHVLKYDAEIVLNDMIPYYEGVESLMEMDEVPYAEGILKLPVMLSKGHEESGTILVGIKENNQMYKVYDDDRHINLTLPKDGLILGSILADILDVEKGDFIYMSGPYFDGDIRIIVGEVVNQNLGATGYIDLELLSDYMQADLQVNSLIIQSTDTPAIREQLLSSDIVQKIEDKDITQALYESLLGSFDFMIVIMQFLAVTIGFTIIYNTAVISISERTREYATLRVLGMTIKEVKEIMSLEYWILCLVGIGLGIPFANFLNMSLINSIDVEAFTWPSAIPSYAFIVGAIGCGAAVAFSNQTSVRTIKKLDLVEVLKERE